jgi:hypothetical protein
MNIDTVSFTKCVCICHLRLDANVQLNRAMFRQNGCCGYVLKPPSLCLPDLLRAPTVIQHTLNVKVRLIYVLIDMH